MQKHYSKHWQRSNKNNKFILVLDVGTTGVKAFVFNAGLEIVSRAYKPLNKFFPQRGWVEQEPNELVSKSIAVLRKAVKESGLKQGDFLGLGITNQRETTILWNGRTGEPVYPAIVWEDNRTKNFCSRFEKKYGSRVRKKTGLHIDSYFSASKIRWILDTIPKAQELLQQRSLAFGTVDSWVLWNLGKDNPHCTDYTNASRTLLFNIKTLRWDKELCKIFCVSPEILPCVKPSRSFFGNLKKDVLGFSLPILSLCGDQQASMYTALRHNSERAGMRAGTTKVTHGTGTFMMQVIGKKFALYPQFFTTLVPDTSPLYALEAKIEGTGKQAEQLLRRPEELKAYLRKLASQVDVYLKKLPLKPKELIVDGGIARSEYLVSTQADISKLPVRRQKTFDGTALGAALLAQHR